MNKSYYSILDIDTKATDEQIKSAYKTNAIKYHPDKNTDDLIYTKKFQEIVEAYNCLINSRARAEYDRKQQNSYTKSQPFEPVYSAPKKEDTNGKINQSIELSYKLSDLLGEIFETPLIGPLLFIFLKAVLVFEYIGNSWSGVRWTLLLYLIIYILSENVILKYKRMSSLNIFVSLISIGSIVYLIGFSGFLVLDGF